MHLWIDIKQFNQPLMFQGTRMISISPFSPAKIPHSSCQFPNRDDSFAVSEAPYCAGWNQVRQMKLHPVGPEDLPRSDEVIR
jgi:hypothetical protein